MLFLIVALTLPIGRPNRDPHWLDARRFPLRRMIADAALNVVLFAPLGWALHRATRASGLAALLVVGLRAIGAG
ncbi:MAG: hypothetical protein HYR51_20495 [Candidatus Rokubacteria bacterium]|nr:hypothetical protein [Candidatus Rokubacteria bacterium]